MEPTHVPPWNQDRSPGRRRAEHGQDPRRRRGLPLPLHHGATLVRLLERGEAVLGGLDLTGDPREALRTLVESSWRLIADAGAVLRAAQSVLPPGRIRELHAKPAQRVEELIRRGQSDGAFRTDLPASWLVSVLYHVLKGGRPTSAAAASTQQTPPHVITATALAAYASPEEP